VRVKQAAVRGRRPFRPARRRGRQATLPLPRRRRDQAGTSPPLRSTSATTSPTMDMRPSLERSRCRPTFPSSHATTWPTSASGPQSPGPSPLLRPSRRPRGSNQPPRRPSARRTCLSDMPDISPTSLVIALTLARLPARVALVDDEHPASTTDDGRSGLLLQRLQRAPNLHDDVPLVVGENGIRHAEIPTNPGRLMERPA
jgi:hypothetical protein